MTIIFFAQHKLIIIVHAHEKQHLIITIHVHHDIVVPIIIIAHVQYDPFVSRHLQQVVILWFYCTSANILDPFTQPT